MIGALGLIALAASGVAFKDPVIERVCLWKLESGDGREQRAAMEWLSSRGSVKAIPLLMKSISLETLETLVKAPSSRFPLDSRGEAAGALAVILDRKLTEAAPDVAQSVFAACRADLEADETIRYRAGRCLIEIGKPAVPFLTAALRDPSPEARARAAWLLGRIGVEAEEALPALADLSRDADESVRREAGAAARRIGPPAE